MALTEQVVLDIQSAQRQISALETQLQGLSTPVDVPVTVSGEQQLAQIRQDLGLADNAADDLNRELAQTGGELRDAGTAARRAGDDIETAGRRGGSAFSGLRGTVIGLVGALGAIQGVRAAFNFAGDAIQSASDLEQSVGALQAVFGDLGEDVAAFGDIADQSVGLAASQFNQLASLLGSQLQTFGFNVSDAADESQRLIGVAADLAATFGGPVSDAVEAISSLLRGEVNPIERYGVAMNETLVAAKALELGLAGTTSELTLQDKTMARLAILTEQTANAQGQFARESETTAGRLERIRADFENLTAEIGEALVPSFQAILDAAPSIASAIEGLVPAFVDFADSIAEIDFVEFIDGLRRAGTTASGVIQFLQGDFAGSTAAGFINDFNETVAAGVEPARAFVNVLSQFEGFRFDVAQNLDAAEVARVVAELQNVADLDFGELQALRQDFEEFGPTLGLTESELAGVIQGLREAEAAALDLQRKGIDPADRKFLEFNRTLDEIPDGAVDVVAALDAVGEALTGLEGIDATDTVTSIGDLIGSLPDELDGAAAALRDSENEIIDDFSVFLANLEDELAARQTFADNIALLRAMGLDDLAEVFTAEGLDAAGALADAVANPEEAARAEAALDAFATQQALSFRDTFVSILQDSPLDLTIPLNVVGTIQSLQVQGIPGQDAAQIVGAAGAGPNVGGGVTVNNNFYTEPQPSTDTARITQATNALVQVE